MTGFFEQTKIDIPIIEEQNAVVEIYDQLLDIQNTFSDFDSSISELLNKQVIIENS